MIKQPAKLFPSFQFVNSERLSLAVCLAKRDVAKLRYGPVDSNALPLVEVEPDEQLVLDPSSKLPKHQRLPGASVDYLDRNQVINERPATQSSHRLFSRSRMVQIPKNRSTESKSSLSSQMPVRSHSPPTRDIDDWVPSKTRPPLHAPTEKQLKSAQESQLRQLQNKVARYSAALAEIRGSNLEQAKSSVIHPSKSIRKSAYGKPDPTTNFKHRPRRASFRLSARSSIRPRSLPLRHKVQCQPESGQPIGPVCLSSSTNAKPRQSLSVQPMRTGVDYNVKSLWEQALGIINPECSEIVVLQPEKSISQQNLNQVPSCTRCLPFENSIPNNSQDQIDSDPINEAVKTLLNEIDVAEAEEESIRRRWTDLNLVDNSINLSARQSYQIRTMPINNKQHESIREWETVEKPKFDRSAATATVNRQPAGNSPILFTKPIQPSQIQKLSQCGKSPSVIVNNEPDESSSHQILRLPVHLHRGLLASSSNRACRQEQAWSNYGGLAPNAFGTIPLVGACEQLAALIVDQSLDEALNLVEQATNDLVEELVKGEMFSEAPPDSTRSIDISQYGDLSDLMSDAHRPISPLVSKTEPDPMGLRLHESSRTPVSCSSTIKHSPETLVNETVEENQYTSEFESISESGCCGTGILVANLNIEQLDEPSSGSDC